MKNPIRTEAEAFSFVIVCALVFLVVALAGAFLGGWVALAVFVALAVGAFIGIYMKSEPKVREPAVWDRRPRSEDGARRILVVANETVAGRALRGEIVLRAKAGRPRPRRLPGAQLPDPPLGLRRGSRARGSAEASRRLCSASWRGRALRLAARWATPIRFRRSRTRSARSGRTRSSSRRIRPAGRTGSRRVWSDALASASTFRSRTWSSISSTSASTSRTSTRA